MKKHISSLNGLRTICILIVIAGHFNRHNFFIDTPVLRYCGFLLFNGALGVNVFFVISGFLITTLLINERERTGTISLKKFYMRRTLRIFPAYYFLLLVYFVLQMVGYLHFNLRDWLVNISYTKQFLPGFDDEAGHLWSLSVEEFFYLLWPLIFIISKKNNVKVIITAIAAITITRFFGFAYPLPKFSNTIFTTGDALLVGCLFAIKHTEIAAWVGKWKKWSVLIFPAIVFTVFTYAYLFHLASAPVGSPKSYIVLHFLLPVAYTLLGNIGLLTNLIIGVTVVLSINFQNLWYSFLNFPFMEYIGKLSYSIYLWQQLFTQDKPFLHKIPLLLLLVFIALSAVFSYYIIEKPFLKLKGRFDAVK